MRRAFTLVELLVVVSIVALLLGLIAPSLSGGRAAARELLCQNNLRQIAAMTQAYRNDHPRIFPGGFEDIGLVERDGPRVFYPSTMACPFDPATPAEGQTKASYVWFDFGPRQTNATVDDYIDGEGWGWMIAGDTPGDRGGMFYRHGARGAVMVTQAYSAVWDATWRVKAMLDGSARKRMGPLSDSEYLPG
jgi:prepilin-type N-terminal cleavage/methylation domain-containing protein